MDSPYAAVNYDADTSDYEAAVDTPPERRRLLRGETLKRLRTDKYGRDFDKENLTKRLRYYIPILSWLPKYRLADLPHDLLAGMAVACLLIPQSLSYASLANLDPVYGLYASFVPIMIYIVLGTSRHAAVGPEAVVSIMTGVAVASAEDEETKLELVATLTCLVGLFTFALGFFRLGYLDCLLSRATNRGFITGVAIVVFVEQLTRALGLVTEWEHELSTLEKVIFVFKHISETRLAPCLFSSLGLAFLLAFKYARQQWWSQNAYMRLFPSILLLVIVSELFAWGLGLTDEELPMLGDIKGGFVMPRAPRLNSENVSRLFLAAVVISIVGFVESIVVSKEKANKHGYAISDNRELVAFGVANTFNSFFGGYPAYASLSRTSVADASGTRSQLHGLLTGILVLFAILFMLPAFKYLPEATQAAIVLFAAIGLFEMHDLAFLWRIRAYQDLLMAGVTFFVTLLVSVEVGIFVSILISIGLVMRETTKPTFDVLGLVPGTNNKFVELGKHGAEAVEGFTILHLHDSLYFANSGLLKDRLRRVELFGSLASHPGDDVVARTVKAIIFDIERMIDIDASALQIMMEITEHYEGRGIRVAFVRTNETVRNKFERAGLLDIASPSHFFDSTREAIEFLSRPNDDAIPVSP